MSITNPPPDTGEGGPDERRAPDRTPDARPRAHHHERRRQHLHAAARRRPPPLGGGGVVDVKCFEGQARASAEHLAKGRQVAVSGRSELDKWQSPEGTERQRLYVIPEAVELLANKLIGDEPVAVIERGETAV